MEEEQQAVWWLGKGCSMAFCSQRTCERKAVNFEEGESAKKLRPNTEAAAQGWWAKWGQIKEYGRRLSFALCVLSSLLRSKLYEGRKSIKPLQGTEYQRKITLIVWLFFCVLLEMPFKTINNWKRVKKSLVIAWKWLPKWREIGCNHAECMRKVERLLRNFSLGTKKRSWLTISSSRYVGLPPYFFQE